MNFKDKYKILDTDSDEVKAGKQSLLDLYAAFEGKGFDPTSDEGKKAIMAVLPEPVKVKLGAKEMEVKDAFAKLQEMQDEMSVKIAKMGQNGSANKPKSLGKALTEALEPLKDTIATKGAGSINLELKDVVTIGVGNTIGDAASDGQVLISENTGIIAPIRKPLMTYLQSVSLGTISTTNAVWVEEVDEEGTPIFIAEANAKTPISVQYLERKKEVRKIGVTGKLTYELMQDLPQLVSFIQTNMMRRVEIATETQLFNGNDLTNNLAGLIGYATAFTGGTLAGKVVDPNNYDVIRAIALQVFEAFGQASAIFVKAGSLAEMELQKAEDGHYLLPPFATNDGTRVSGVRLIETTQLPAGTEFLGGDLSVVQVRFREGMNVTIGESGDDFSNNLKTIKIEQRLVQFVSANDTQVLVKGAFDTAIAALTPTT
jgi:hypothetical protein